MMEFGSVDRRNELDTDEFEKLEFVSEEPADPTPEPDDTAEIIFTPEEDATPEPPVSFSPSPDPDATIEGDFQSPVTTPPELDFGAGTPFELFGTSLFDDPELDNELDSLEDLEF